MRKYPSLGKDGPESEPSKIEFSGFLNKKYKTPIAKSTKKEMIVIFFTFIKRRYDLSLLSKEGGYLQKLELVPPRPHLLALHAHGVRFVPLFESEQATLIFESAENVNPMQ